MKLTTTLLATAAMSLAGIASAQEMTIVSWGGAYTKSQLKAYHEPYSANTGVTIINTPMTCGCVVARLIVG